AEGAELGKISVVENQNEAARLVPQALQQVRVATRKIPHVAGIEIVRLGVSLWIGDRGTDATLEHERPFSSRGVPVQLAHYSRLELHRHAGDALGDGQLLDRYFFAKALAEHPAGRLLERELE